MGFFHGFGNHGKKPEKICQLTFSHKPQGYQVGTDFSAEHPLSFQGQLEIVYGYQPLFNKPGTGSLWCFRGKTVKVVAKQGLFFHGSFEAVGCPCFFSFIVVSISFCILLSQLLFCKNR